jgi:hypothetical protein
VGNVTAADAKELINTTFEGLISLVTVVGSGLMIEAHPESTSVVSVATGALMAVIIFWFGQRGQVKAVNGNISAMADIARNMVASNQDTKAGVPNG